MEGKGQRPRSLICDTVLAFVATKYRSASAVLPPPLAPPPATGGGDLYSETVTRGGGGLLPRRSPCPGLLCRAPRWGLLIGAGRPQPAKGGTGVWQQAEKEVEKVLHK